MPNLLKWFTSRGRSVVPLPGDKGGDTGGKKTSRKPGKAGFLDLLKRFEEVQRIECCVDVGANVGKFAASVRSTFPEARLYCFEPGSSAFAALRERFRGDPLVTLERCALGDEKRTGTLHVNAADVTNSLLPNAPGAGRWVKSSAMLEPQGVSSVEVETLDDYCRLRGIEKIDLLKIDTQGYDLRVLQGADRLLRAGSVGWIYVEINVVPLYVDQGEMHLLFSHLAERGYRLFTLDGLQVDPKGRLKWMNGLFVSDSLNGRLELRTQPDSPENPA